MKNQRLTGCSECRKHLIWMLKISRLWCLQKVFWKKTEQLVHCKSIHLYICNPEVSPGCAHGCEFTGQCVCNTHPNQRWLSSHYASGSVLTTSICIFLFSSPPSLFKDEETQDKRKEGRKGDEVGRPPTARESSGSPASRASQTGAGVHSDRGGGPSTAAHAIEPLSPWQDPMLKNISSGQVCLLIFVPKNRAVKTINLTQGLGTGICLQLEKCVPCLCHGDQSEDEMIHGVQGDKC